MIEIALLAIALLVITLTLGVPLVCFPCHQSAAD